MGDPLSLTLLGTLPLTPGSVEPWVTSDQLDFARADQSVDLQNVCNVATEILYLLSGRRYGIRTETIRPCIETCGTFVDWSSFYGPWISQQRDYGPSYLSLKSPVLQVLSVKLDGSVVSPTSYAVYNNRRLVRLPDAVTGQAWYWPLSQRLDLPDTSQGTFSVQYQWGTIVSAGAKTAAKVFATELAKYVAKEPCALADRTTTVTRQGVTQTVLDPMQFLNEGRTGLYLVDSWLGSINPNGLRRRPTVTSPDQVELARLT